MNNKIPNIYSLIKDLSWYFGSQGFNGECCGDLTLAEFMTLKKVHENGNITIQQIGITLNFTKGAVSKIIDRLENKGYVSREISSSDGRMCCVITTERGMETIKSITKQYSNFIEKALKDYDAEAIDNINSVLDILVESIQRQGYIKEGKVIE